MSKDYNPRMHSAEHILNQTMVRMFNKGRSFSAHIEKKKSKCDYHHFERNLSPEEVVEIEKKVNEIIAANLPVRESFIPKEEAAVKFNLERLPEEAGDSLRIISMGDYDDCPCIGHHVEFTSEIGGFKIISTDFGEGILRIRFKLLETVES